MPEFVKLLKDLTLCCLISESFATNSVLKALSTFLLRIFNHSTEMTALFLKQIEPVAKVMLSKVNNNVCNEEILNTWSVIINLFKKFPKSLSYEMLKKYEQNIISAASNHFTSEITSTIFDVNNSIDDESKKLLNGIQQSLGINKIKVNDGIDKLKKKTTPVGSFLNRKSINCTSKTPGKENFVKPQIVNIEPDSQVNFFITQVKNKNLYITL